MSRRARRRIDAALFVGPSLKREDLAAPPEGVLVLPPAAQGDIYRLSQFAPRIIGLVDGFFQSVPAPWHKEILWALSRGTLVLGASSMGALRAAELAPFGMVPVGRIARAFADGALTDDDEVAIVHGPAEIGYPALSFAMVDLRATLQAAVDAGVIGREDRGRILDAAKAIHFRDRTLAALPDCGGAVDAAALDWIRANWIDQKRRDARELVRTMAARLADGPSGAPAPPAFAFEHTHAWQEVRRKHRALFDMPEIGVRDLLAEIALRGAGFVRSIGADPVPDPWQPPLPDAAPGDPLRLDHDPWLGRLVAKLEAAGVHDELCRRALGKKRGARASGALTTGQPAEALVAAHFAVLGEPVAWFDHRRAGAWESDPEFWHEFDAYARALGLDDSDQFVDAVVRDRLLSGG